jgi:hypothetical protein
VLPPPPPQQLASSTPRWQGSSYLTRTIRCNTEARRVRETIVAVEKQQVLHISLCACAYWRVDLHNMQCACAVWCRLWPHWLHHIFRHYLINGIMFRRKLLSNTKYVLVSSTTLLWTFLILKRIQRDIGISVKTWSRKVPVVLLIFW